MGKKTIGIWMIWRYRLSFSKLREEACRLNLELPKNNLVTWTGGNVSVRDPESGLVAIKPSGVRYEAITPESMVILDLQGNIIEGENKPSSDTYTHLHLYRHRPDLNGVVHTHSPFATAFAALGKSIPVYLTAMGDEFGGPIPCGRFALIGDEEIGKAILEVIGDSRAVLMKNHGVFTVGKTGENAVKAAVMVEDIAHTTWIALQLGIPDEITPEDVKKLHYRYTHVYGQ
jgi:L-ribulose-5-phosphate 4-epimerase